MGRTRFETLGPGCWGRRVSSRCGLRKKCMDCPSSGRVRATPTYSAISPRGWALVERANAGCSRPLAPTSRPNPRPEQRERPLRLTAPACRAEAPPAGPLGNTPPESATEDRATGWVRCPVRASRPAKLGIGVQQSPSRGHAAETQRPRCGWRGLGRPSAGRPNGVRASDR